MAVPPPAHNRTISAYRQPATTISAYWLLPTMSMSYAKPTDLSVVQVTRSRATTNVSCDV